MYHNFLIFLELSHFHWPGLPFFFLKIQWSIYKTIEAMIQDLPKDDEVRVSLEQSINHYTNEENHELFVSIHCLFKIHFSKKNFELFYRNFYTRARNILTIFRQVHSHWKMSFPAIFECIISIFRLHNNTTSRWNSNKYRAIRDLSSLSNNDRKCFFIQTYILRHETIC